MRLRTIVIGGVVVLGLAAAGVFTTTGGGSDKPSNTPPPATTEGNIFNEPSEPACDGLICVKRLGVQCEGTTAHVKVRLYPSNPTLDPQPAFSILTKNELGKSDTSTGRMPPSGTIHNVDITHYHFADVVYSSNRGEVTHLYFSADLSCPRR